MDEMLSCFSYPIDAAFILQKKKRLKKILLQKPNLIDKKIALLSGSTIGEIKPILELFLLFHGIRPTFWEGNYHRFYEELVFENPQLAEFSPDVIYIHTSNRNFSAWPMPTDSQNDADDLIAAEMTRFQQAWQGAARYRCPIIQNNFEAPSYRILGNRDGVLPGGRVRFVNACNQYIADYAESHANFYIQDLHYLSSLYGLDQWCDESQWYLYKYTLSTGYIPYLCQNLSNIMKSLFGKNKKSVVTDLDNTLWGGVIGDDGADGIAIGSESPAGMVYSAYQQYLKELSSVGVMLNVASKNEEGIALEGLQRQESILKREDFLCFQANWKPKSQNISAIADKLNILPDSLVFMDDNPAEREIIRQELPEVSVPELSCPEEAIRSIDRSGFFEITSLSEDDKKRGEMYRQNLQRQEQQELFTDYAAYLNSLQMKAQIAPFTLEKLDRITQLINKTNQFNLTTRRYTSAEIKERMETNVYLTLSASLQDKFGDNGLVSALIGKKEGTVLTIELWIMSCRVFQRELEYAVFDELVRYCQKEHITCIEGVYYPTRKNLLVADFYATIGFEKTLETEEERRFLYHVPQTPVSLCHSIQIEQ